MHRSAAWRSPAQAPLPATLPATVHVDVRHARLLVAALVGAPVAPAAVALATTTINKGARPCVNETKEPVRAFNYEMLLLCVLRIFLHKWLSA